MYENEDFELENETSEQTILLADLEWAPLIDYVPWTDPNFTQDIINRLKGVTEESFAKEVELWSDQIKMMPHYDEIEIRKEIRGWEIGIPSKDSFDFETYSIFYSLQVQYRNRITEIISVVYAHHEMLSQAQKSLREMAVRLSNGPKHDKDATATFTVHPFTVATTNAKRMLSYLEATLKNIEFAAYQMDRLLKEHQALARINMNFNNEGMSSMFNKERPSLKQYSNSSAEIKTRNSRLK
jgi:hypothetical protein